MTGLRNIIRSMKGSRSLYSSLLLQTVIIMIYISTMSAESVQSRTDPPNGGVDSQPNTNNVATYSECKKYLCKYGYLSCNCQQYLTRKKRQLPDGMLPTEFETNSDLTHSNTSDSNSTNFNTTTTNSTDMTICTEQDFKNGLKTFQKNYRLEITGMCDERTRFYMSQRRCGQPDTVIDKLEGEKNEDEAASQITKRSLSDILAQNVELEYSIERRKQLLRKYLKDIENEKITQQDTDKTKQREKRSQIYMSSRDYGGLLNKRRIGWRLMSDHVSHFIPPTVQRSTLKLAFRYWSEITPLCFYEHTSEWGRPDIEIGFLEGVHLSCYRQFDGYGGEIAHKFYRDVHFDNSEPYTDDLNSDTRISLLLVAVHELGHVIGLNHSDYANSVMNAIYHQSIHGEFELSNHDRSEVRKAYGPCKGTFDTIFDYVYTKPDTKNTRIYSSYFFRGDHLWLYNNNKKRTRSGDPVDIRETWRNVPNDVSTFLHYYELNEDTMTVRDEYMFFKGDRYYSHGTNIAATSGLIRSKFPSSGSQMPSTIDAAFFDFRSKVNLLYFFKRNKVYSYNYRFSGSHSCCTSVRPIVDVFPPKTLSDLRSSNGTTYATGIDAAYLSMHSKTVYFFKGEHVWSNTEFSSTHRGNKMVYRGPWYNIWENICDGECS